LDHALETIQKSISTSLFLPSFFLSARRVIDGIKLFLYRLPKLCSFFTNSRNGISSEALQRMTSSAKLKFLSLGFLLAVAVSLEGEDFLFFWTFVFFGGGAILDVDGYHEIVAFKT
jgi:hypothetical protein